MKKNKQIVIDEELFKSLSSVPSASGLINELLTDYFNEIGIMTLERLKENLIQEQKKLNETTTRINEIQDKIETIEKRNKYLKDIFQNLPNEILEDFKKFPKMTEDILHQRYKTIYSVIYKIDYEEVLKAFKEFNQTINL